jgi:hypothetical protein
MNIWVPFGTVLGQLASIWPPIGAQMAAQRWVIDRLVNYPPLAADFGVDLGRLGPALAPFGSHLNAIGAKLGWFHHVGSPNRSNSIVSQSGVPRKKAPATGKVHGINSSACDSAVPSSARESVPRTGQIESSPNSVIHGRRPPPPEGYTE